MFKRVAISASVLSTLLVGCGGGGSGDAGSTGKNNINGGQSRVIYPMGVYVATLGNGTDDILRASDTSPRYMGVGIGYHYTGEQQFWSQSVSVDASNDYHKVEVSAGYEVAQSTVSDAMEYASKQVKPSGEVLSSSLRNAKLSNLGWIFGEWRKDLSAVQKAQIQSIHLDDYEFNTLDYGFRMTSEDSGIQGEDFNVWYQQVETEKLIDVLASLPDTEWKSIDAYNQPNAYNRYKFTQVNNGPLMVTAFIEDNGVEYCKTEPKGFAMYNNNQIMRFETKLEASNVEACKTYLKQSGTKPFEGEHGILIGFVKSTSGQSQIAVYHTGFYQEGELEKHQALSGSGMFVKN
ncbi:hypothetical protein CKF94_06715 [Vibrio coralliilyticus]|uniref:hypothetical protein n=1 Tax=Vibrio coralliilyticus TaxID=190893 RepID=UPI000BAAFCEA|nr:hypothetical protein [Vibrio coralliilyticus]PAU39076.1 hypothetical protein CKF94_06715 [Vibrio coralliilyticus]